MNLQGGKLPGDVKGIFREAVLREASTVLRNVASMLEMADKVSKLAFMLGVEEADVNVWTGSFILYVEDVGKLAEARNVGRQLGFWSVEGPTSAVLIVRGSTPDTPAVHVVVPTRSNRADGKVAERG